MTKQERTALLAAFKELCWKYYHDDTPERHYMFIGACQMLSALGLDGFKIRVGYMAELEQEEPALANSKTRTDNVTVMHNLKAERKWREIPEYVRKALEQNVYCTHCGTTSIKPGYGIQLAPTGEIILEGQCQKCGGKVVRLIEK